MVSYTKEFECAFKKWFKKERDINRKRKEKEVGSIL